MAAVEGLVARLQTVFLCMLLITAFAGCHQVQRLKIRFNVLLMQEYVSRSAHPFCAPGPRPIFQVRCFCWAAESELPGGVRAGWVGIAGDACCVLNSGDFGNCDIIVGG